MPIITPSIASTTTMAPSHILNAHSVSSEKLGCPGVSNKLTRYDFSYEFARINDIGDALILIFLSRSSNLVSVNLWYFSFVQSSLCVCLTNKSISDVLPWCK